MNRLTRWIIGFGAVASTMLLAADCGLWVRSYRVPPPAPSTESVRQMLSRPVPPAGVGVVSFSDAVDYLRDCSTVGYLRDDVSSGYIYVNWKAIESVGVDRNVPVAIPAKQVRVGEALRHITASTGRLSFNTEADVVVISTPANLKNVGSAGGTAERDWRSARWELIDQTRRWTFAAYRGDLVLWVGPADPAQPYKASPLPAPKSEGERGWTVGGLSLRHAGYPDFTWCLRLPCWFTAALATVLPLLWARLRRKHQ